MYWTDYNYGKIQRSNLDGTDVEDLVDLGYSGPKDIVLDVANGKMYWTEYFSERIRRANMDGTGVESLDAKNFGGVFDGNGHTISNFSYDSENMRKIGLFRYVKDPGTEIKNLGLINPNVNVSDGYSVGSLIGYLDSASVTGCYVEGGSVYGRREIGGLAGENWSGIISNCYATSEVSGVEFCTGGLVGGNRGRI